MPFKKFVEIGRVAYLAEGPAKVIISMFHIFGYFSSTVEKFPLQGFFFALFFNYSDFFHELPKT